MEWAVGVKLETWRGSSQLVGVYVSLLGPSLWELHKGDARSIALQKAI